MQNSNQRKVWGSTKGLIRLRSRTSVTIVTIGTVYLQHEFQKPFLRKVIPIYRAAERYNVTAHHKQVHQGIKRVAKKYNKPPKMDNEPLSSLGEPTIPTKVIFEDLWICICIYFIITALYIVWWIYPYEVKCFSSAAESPLVVIVALLFSVMGICGRIRFFYQPDF